MCFVWRTPPNACVTWIRPVTEKGEGSELNQVTRWSLKQITRL